MNNRSRTFSWLVALALCTLVGAPALAQDANGLGSNWPSASDVSRSSGFHAYRWIRNGVSFVQVNDASGVPQMAIAAGGGTIIVLPVGAGAGQVRVVQSSPGVGGTPVYTDERVKINLDAGGFTVQSLEAQPCSDPVECAKITNTTVMPAPASTSRTMSAQDTCSDPVECAK